MYHKDFHLTWRVLLHYLVKDEDSKCYLFRCHLRCSVTVLQLLKYDYVRKCRFYTEDGRNLPSVVSTRASICSHNGLGFKIFYFRL